MPSEHFFSGDVKLYTTYNLDDQPAQGSLPLIATFEPDGVWMIKRHHFGTGGRFEIPAESVVISIRQDAAGQHDAAQGNMQIELNCLFELPVGPSSRLKVKLDQNSYQLKEYSVSGTLIDGTTGRVRLAGSGKFAAGLLGGHDCLIEVAGMFNPNPWT